VSSQWGSRTYPTRSGGSTDGENDFTGANGSISFAPGETQKTISVAINNDTAIENTEEFQLTISGDETSIDFSSGVIGYAEILDDDAATWEIVGDFPAAIEEGTTASWNDDPVHRVTIRRTQLAAAGEHHLNQLAFQVCALTRPNPNNLPGGATPEGLAVGTVGGVAVGDDEPATAHTGAVDEGMDQEHAGGQHIREFLQRLGLAHHVGERAITFGGAVHGARQHRHLGHRHRRACRADGGIDEERGAAPAGGVGVAVGVGLPGDQPVGVGDHFLGDVGVEVESGNDRDVGADEGAGARQQVALDVVHRLGDSGTVQRQQDRVHGDHRLQRRQEIAAQRLVALVRQGTARARRGEQQWRRPCLTLGQDLQHPAHDATGHVQHVVAVAELEALEGGDVDRPAAEVVAFGQDPPDSHAWSGHVRVSSRSGPVSVAATSIG